MLVSNSNSVCTSKNIGKFIGICPYRSIFTVMPFITIFAKTIRYRKRYGCSSAITQYCANRRFCYCRITCPRSSYASICGTMCAVVGNDYGIGMVHVSANNLSRCLSTVPSVWIVAWTIEPFSLDDNVTSTETVGLSSFCCKFATAITNFNRSLIWTRTLCNSYVVCGRLGRMDINGFWSFGGWPYVWQASRTCCQNRIFARANFGIANYRNCRIWSRVNSQMNWFGQSTAVGQDIALCRYCQSVVAFIGFLNICHRQVFGCLSYNCFPYRIVKRIASFAVEPLVLQRLNESSFVQVCSVYIISLSRTQFCFASRNIYLWYAQTNLNVVDCKVVARSWSIRIIERQPYSCYSCRNCEAHSIAFPLCIAYIWMSRNCRSCIVCYYSTVVCIFNMEVQTWYWTWWVNVQNPYGEIEFRTRAQVVDCCFVELSRGASCINLHHVATRNIIRMCMVWKISMPSRMSRKRIFYKCIYTPTVLAISVVSTIPTINTSIPLIVSIIITLCNIPSRLKHINSARTSRNPMGGMGMM